MRSLLLISGLCVLITGIAIPQKTDRERDGLKGAVKTVSVRQATMSTEDGKQTESALVLSHVIAYDRLGNRTELAIYDRTGALNRRIAYQYDPVTKRRSCLTVFNSQSAIVRRVADKYGSNGFKVSSTVEDFNEDGTFYRKTELTFGQLSELISVAEYGADGSLIKKDSHPLETAERESIISARSHLTDDADRVVSYGEANGEYFDLDIQGNWTRGMTGSSSRTYGSGKKTKTAEWTYREIIYY